MTGDPLTDNNSVAGLLQLLEDLPKDFKCHTIVEVGSFAGVSSDLFANFCDNLICVDIWNFKGGQGLPYDYVQQAFIDFCKVDEAHDNIETMVMASTKAAEKIKDGSIELVYIDAKHDKPEVLQDIKVWLPKVKKGGYIAGHDIHMDGVRQAVEEMFGTSYKTYKDTSWIVQINR
jgi:predicted O-methyltransferase YrrM